MTMRRAFTLIELMMVVAVIAILATMVTVAASGSIKTARSRRATAMAAALEQGVAAYYAQEGVWPKTIENKVSNMEDDTYTFTDDEAAKILRDVVGHAWGKDGGSVRSVLVDSTALFVARSGNSHGIDFTEAIKRNGRNYIPFAQMVFGYQDEKSGTFSTFEITYNARTDSVTVKKNSSGDDNQ